MKARLNREMDCRNPEFSWEALKKAQARGDEYRVSISGPKPAGTVIDHPNCWRLVQMGVAVPEDDACREKCGMTPEQIAAATVAYDRQEARIAGLLPEEGNDDFFDGDDDD